MPKHYQHDNNHIILTTMAEETSDVKTLQEVLESTKDLSRGHAFIIRQLPDKLFRNVCGRVINGKKCNQAIRERSYICFANHYTKVRRLRTTQQLHIFVSTSEKHQDRAASARAGGRRNGHGHTGTSKAHVLLLAANTTSQTRAHEHTV